jgi:hypothetical protein
MSGARTHGSLTKDEEVNAAAWAAGRGAVVGASKVCYYSSFIEAQYQSMQRKKC